jgi:hypothetical protein
MSFRHAPVLGRHARPSEWIALIEGHTILGARGSLHRSQVRIFPIRAIRDEAFLRLVGSIGRLILDMAKLRRPSVISGAWSGEPRFARAGEQMKEELSPVSPTMEKP